MATITLSIPKELLTKFKEQFPEVNVAAVARKVVLDKIEELKKLEKLKSEGKI